MLSRRARSSGLASQATISPPSASSISRHSATKSAIRSSIAGRTPITCRTPSAAKALTAVYPLPLVMLTPPVGAVNSFERRLGLMRIDFVAEASGRPKRQPEEFQLVGARPRALCKQFKAAFAHLRILLVGEQLDAIVQRADGREQIMAQ